MERVKGRISLPWPELALVACGLILVLVITFRSSTSDCHHWKQRLHDVSAAFLGAAGAEEHPLPGHPSTAADDHAALSRAASRVLDERPFACL
jgi:hypothetical protein